MERRTKLLIVILVALILLGIGFWILLQPILQPGGPATPTPTPTTVAPKPVTAPTTPTTPRTSPLVQPTGAEVLKQLQDRAGAFVSRIGSGSSADGFLGYADVLLEATPDLRTKLAAEQRALQQAHPSAGPRFGMVTRVVSTDARSAVAGAASISFGVQVQQAEDAGNPGKPTSVKYKLATVAFAKQGDGTYLVSGLTWEDVKL